MEKPVLNQSPVIFKSDTHQYFLKKNELQGITQTLIKRAYPDTYKRPDIYTEEQWQEILNNAAAKGSVMHETIELHDELGIESDLPELQNYKKVLAENDLEVLASEYVVSDEKHYATAIDKVLMRRSDGGIILVDFKRTFTMHIENVTVQQSICKRWFEKLNPKLKVAAIYVLWMRDDQYKFIELKPWADEALDYLIDCDINDKPFELAKIYGDLPVRFAEVEDEVARLEIDLKAAQERQKTLKQGLYDLMTNNNIKSWTGSRLKLTRVLPTTSETFDTKAFKEEHPDLYKQYVKPSQREGSLKITIVK